MNDSDIIEGLADLAHEQWSGWIRYLFSRSTMTNEGTVVIPSNLVARWQRQMHTPYRNLPDNEKESDRIEARKVIAYFESIDWGMADE